MIGMVLPDVGKQLAGGAVVADLVGLPRAGQRAKVEVRLVATQTDARHAPTSHADDEDGQP